MIFCETSCCNSGKLDDSKVILKGYHEYREPIVDPGINNVVHPYQENIYSSKNERIPQFDQNNVQDNYYDYVQSQPEQTAYNPYNQEYNPQNNFFPPCGDEVKRDKKSEYVDEDGTTMLPHVHEYLNRPVEIYDREYPPQKHHKNTIKCGGEQNKTAEPSKNFQYGIPYSDDVDPGVFAVSNALFETNTAFHSIPLFKNPKQIFSRRKKYMDTSNEWSNAFVTHIDPCECVAPQIAVNPYEVYYV